MAERRMHTRLDLMYKVIYSTVRNPSERIRAESFNISLGGIGLKINNIIKGNSHLNLLIFKPGEKVPVEAKGELVWQNSFNDTALGRAGIQFTEIAWTELKKLLEEIV